MELSSEPLSPNRPDVIDENFDGESVIVNLKSGCYFSLNPPATALWALLAEGRSPRSLADSADVDDETIAAFVAQLHEEDLVVAGGTDAGPAPTALGGTPTLEKFTDMQALLVVDPIHDIDLDGDGWPVAQA
jgi:hypothetical protein